MGWLRLELNGTKNPLVVAKSLGLGFRVYGFGFRVKGLEFRV
jgi:hypothetical protein